MDSIKATYYSKFADGNDKDLICFHCGDICDTEAFQNYVDKKNLYSIVWSTCKKEYCEKKPLVKQKYQRAKQLDKKIQKNWSE